MRRVRVLDYQLTDGPRQTGISSGDIAVVCQSINAAQERLRYDQVFGDEGPPGSFAEVAISVPRNNPYITCPRGVDGLSAIDVCKHPIPLSNQFAEYLLFGTGHMPKCDRWNGLAQRWRGQAGFTRNYSPTFSDLSGGPKRIMIVPENVEDAVPNPQSRQTARVLVQGLCNGVPVVTVEAGRTVPGEYVLVTQPYAMTQNAFDPPALTGIQKDVTLGNIQVWQADPTYGTAEIISVMEPSETTGWHRRYYIDRLPPGCCPFQRICPPSPVTGIAPSPPCPLPPPIQNEFVEVTALARLEMIPVSQPEDWLFIQSIEALKLECMAGYMYGIQDAGSKQQAAEYHKRAVQILIGQSYAEEGKNAVAANVAPFGRTGWGRVNLAMR